MFFIARPSHPVTECSVVSLLPVSSTCLSCGRTAHVAYHTQRTIATLAGRSRLDLTVRRCRNARCPRYHQPYRPEAEGSWALPHGEYGLDVIALVGMLRYRHPLISGPMSKLGMPGYIGLRTFFPILSSKLRRQVQQDYQSLLDEMRQAPCTSEPLRQMLTTFLKVTGSYWSGLFSCYDLSDLPRTNNDLEHTFGSARYHERRSTGRKQASPGLVIRGAVRIVGSCASQNYRFSGPDLQPRDTMQWRTLHRMSRLVMQLVANDFVSEKPLRSI